MQVITHMLISLAMIWHQRRHVYHNVALEMTVPVTASTSMLCNLMSSTRSYHLLPLTLVRFFVLCLVALN
jgi:hypothetical protein